VKGLEVPPEAIALNDHEKELVKAGSVIFVIRNDHGVGPGGTDVKPVIHSVRLMPN
jgi:hypothetical protein